MSDRISPWFLLELLQTNSSKDPGKKIWRNHGSISRRNPRKNIWGNFGVHEGFLDGIPWEISKWMSDGILDGFHGGVPKVIFGRRSYWVNPRRITYWVPWGILEETHGIKIWRNRERIFWKKPRKYSWGNFIGYSWRNSRKNSGRSSRRSSRSDWYTSQARELPFEFNRTSYGMPYCFAMYCL